MMDKFAPLSYFPVGQRPGPISAIRAELSRKTVRARPMLYAIASLFCFQLLGEFIVRLCGLPLPGALIGTLLLLLALLVYRRLPKPLEDTASALLQNMMLLFIPVIAGVMQEFDHLRREWLPFVLACVAGAALTFMATALTFRGLLRYQRARQSADTAGRETA